MKEFNQETNDTCWLKDCMNENVISRKEGIRTFKKKLFLKILIILKIEIHYMRARRLFYFFF